ncbi:MAG: PilW family protein [Wenzhouxiangella sp.]|jgi:type IV pilus assembly protein PilW|nr:PilW family protein [Wenzhouxiangella sp.]
MRRFRRKLPAKASGFSLIELMIAMVLGLLVLAAVIQLFLGSKATYTSNEALARVQENGRFSLELLKREFRDSSSRGFCAARLAVQNHLDTDCSSHPDTFFAAEQAVMGWDFTGTERGDDYTLPADLSADGIAVNQWSAQLSDGSAESLPSWLQNRVVPGSDVIVIRRPEVVPGIAADVSAWAGAGADELYVTAPHGLEVGEIALVTNCSTGVDLFQNTGTGEQLNRSGGSCNSTGPGNSTSFGQWATAYDQSMQLFRIRVLAYYIGMNATTQEPGLYRYDVTSGTAEELVSGVENMQILFGYSNTADDGGDGQTVNHWLPASEVPNWEFVIGARLALLVRSPENMGDGTTQQTFDLASTSVTHQEDGRLRQLFFSSISLRNRQLVM